MSRRDLIRDALKQMPPSARRHFLRNTLSLGGLALLTSRRAQKQRPPPAPRPFLRNTLSLGGLAMLTGCSVVNENAAEKVLRHVSRFNDRFQAWLFDPNKLAPTYPESMITQ